MAHKISFFFISSVLLLSFGCSSKKQITKEYITYVMQEEESYPNSQYLPLLDIVFQLEDYYEGYNQTKIQPNWGDRGGASQLRYEEINKGVIEDRKVFLDIIKENLVDLLSGACSITFFNLYNNTKKYSFSNPSN